MDYITQHCSLYTLKWIGIEFSYTVRRCIITMMTRTITGELTSKFRRLQQHDNDTFAKVARILAVIGKAGYEDDDGATRLKIMGRAYLSYNKTLNYLDLARRAGLITYMAEKKSYKLTKEGREWLEENDVT